MKQRTKHYSKSALATVLALCMLLSCITVGLIPTDAAQTQDEAVGAGPYTIYMIPKKDMADKGTTYRLNYKNTNDTWGQASFSFTGRTYGGRPVYKTTFSPATTDSYNCQLQVGTGGSFSWDLYAGSHDWSNWNGKYFDANGSGTWNNSITFDTYKLRNETTDLGTLTWDSSASKYILSNQQLTRGTTYKLNVYNASYSYGSKYFQCTAKTWTETGNVDLYAYDKRSSDAVVSVTPEITSTFNFEWTLADSQNDNQKQFIQKGNLKATFPTLYTVSYTLGDHVSYNSVTGGTKTADGTIKAQSGSNVAITVAYDEAYEYGTSSTLDGATLSNGNKTFTFSSISADKTITINAQKSKFTVTVTAGSGGSITTPSGGSYTNLEIEHDPKTITAAPDTANNYAFNGWSCDNGKVTFANVNNATTTFTATGTDTIRASFIQDTVHDVTVNNGNPSQASTVSAGTYVMPELTADAPDDDEYSFTGWTLSGNVSLAPGYNATDPTIKIQATGSDDTGVVTANYTKVNYIYFYAALQYSWSSDPVVTVDGEEIGAYNWIAQKANSDSPKTLYSGSAANTQIGGNDCFTYYIGVYRVPTSKVGKNISVFNSKQTGTDINKGYIGTLTNDQGRCYYTYSDGTDYNHSGSITPQKVDTVTLDKADYDADEPVTISKSVTVYSGTKTAGQDDFTYTYTLVNTSTNATTDLGTDLSSSQGNLIFTPKNEGVTSAGNYKVVITTKDSKTGRIINSCESSQFAIQAEPTQSTVTFSGTHATVTGTYSYKGVTQNLTNGASLRAGSVVTLTYVLNEGYTYNASISDVTASGVTLSASNKTYTSGTRTLVVQFTVPTGGTPIVIGYSATEVMHSVSLVKRFFNFNGTSTTTSNVTWKSISAGIDTAANTGNAPTEENYSFTAFRLPSYFVSSDTSVTLVSGSLTDSNSISVKATADSKTIYLDYYETVYSITTTVNTVNGNTPGAIQRSNSNIASTNIGYVTAVTLSAVNNPGYDFDHWEITKGTATNAVVNGTTYNLGSSAKTIAKSTAPASTTFKFNGTATVKAVFTAVPYSISAVFVANNGYNEGNSVTVTDTSDNHKGSGNVGDTFIIKVTLADGYEVASITGAPQATPTPTKTGNVWKYQYTLGAASVSAVVTLKAVKPSLSNVQLKGTANNFAYVTLNANNRTNVPHYYLQPDVAVATTDSFSTLTFDNTNNSERKTEISSGTAVSLDPPTVTLNAENATASYTFTVTATNAPDGVTAETETVFCTVVVSFNDAQKVYFRLNKLMGRCVSENESNNLYFKTNAQLRTYNTAYNNAKVYLGGGYPAYDAGSAEVTEATTKFSALSNALGNLDIYANTTTVYILSQYSDSSSNPINVKVTSKGSDADYKHFLMYSYGESNELLVADDYSYAMCKADYYGAVTRNSTNYYIYRFKFAGHVNLQVWRGSSDTDTVMDNSERLSGVVPIGNAYRDYDINLYNQSVNSASVTACEEYTDFNVIKNGGKKYVELNATVTEASLQNNDFFNFRAAGTFLTAPGGTIDNSITSYKITGPKGKGTLAYDGYELHPNRSVTLTTQGKYEITCVIKFGTDADGHDLVREGKAILYVAFDDITIYVDMNSNVGNPILNFEYKTDSSGTPDASGAYTAYLPYEMDLVTGSESIYKYTIKMTKLRQDYNIDFSGGNPIKISYITVENQKIGEGTGFFIGKDARINGEAWLKADSTKLTTFDVISYSSVTSSFVAVDESQSSNIAPLSSAITAMKGTGVNTDDEEIYHAKYASLYVLENQSAPMKNFNYVLKTSAARELKVGNNTYYFDKWVKFTTPSDGLALDSNGYLPSEFATKLTGDPDIETESTDINFTKASEYSEEESDYTYVALYKLASSGDSTVRLDITYNFEDYDTTDGNYIYDSAKATVPASYTKTVKIEVGAGKTYADFAAVKLDINTIAGLYAPHVASNYFNYSYHTGSAVVAANGEVTSESKLVVNASLDKEARPYKIIVKNGETVYETVTRSGEDVEMAGNYQQTFELKTSDFGAGSFAHPVWKDSAGNILATGKTYIARFVSSGNESEPIESVDTDCQIIKVYDDEQASAAYKSVISNAFTEVYYSGDTEMLRHNFYIIDYCGNANGEFVGGGVLFATTDRSGNYRQSGVSGNLDTWAHRQSFISGILNGDYNTEYKAQSINNVGFRYKPYKNTEDVFRYSDELGAYLTVFEGTNVNSTNYDGQKLRVFSFMVYYDSVNDTNVIVPSEGYAEVERYKNTAAG